LTKNIKKHSSKLLKARKKKRYRVRKSRAKISQNPKVQRRKIIKMVEKINHWKSLKYKKIQDKYWKGQEQEDDSFEEDSHFNPEIWNFSENSSNLTQLEKVDTDEALACDTTIFRSVGSLLNRQKTAQKAYRYMNLKFRFTMERIRRKVKNSLTFSPPSRAKNSKKTAQ
jgi:hypothetical protein